VDGLTDVRRGFSVFFVARVSVTGKKVASELSMRRQFFARSFERGTVVGHFLNRER